MGISWGFRRPTSSHWPESEWSIDPERPRSRRQASARLCRIEPVPADPRVTSVQRKGGIEGRYPQDNRNAVFPQEDVLTRAGRRHGRCCESRNRRLGRGGRRVWREDAARLLIVRCAPRPFIDTKGNPPAPEVTRAQKRAISSELAPSSVKKSASTEMRADPAPAPRLRLAGSAAWWWVRHATRRMPSRGGG